jgi:hypothetical protein
MSSLHQTAEPTLACSNIVPIHPVQPHSLQIECVKVEAIYLPLLGASLRICWRKCASIFVNAKFFVQSLCLLLHPIMIFFVPMGIETKVFLAWVEYHCNYVCLCLVGNCSTLRTVYAHGQCKLLGDLVSGFYSCCPVSQYDTSSLYPLILVEACWILRGQIRSIPGGYSPPDPSSSTNEMVGVA